MLKRRKTKKEKKKITAFLSSFQYNPGVSAPRASSYNF